MRSRVANIRGHMPRSGVCGMHIKVATFGGVAVTTSIGTYGSERFLQVNVAVFREVSLHTSKSGCGYIDQSNCLLRVPEMARP